MHDCGGGLRFLRALYVMWVSQDLQVLRGAEMGLGDRGAGRTAAQVVAFLSSDWWRSLWRRAGACSEDFLEWVQVWSAAG